MAQPLQTNFPEHVYLGKFFERYKDHNEMAPSSWIVWNDKTSKEHLMHACHAQMQYDDPGYTDMITAVPNTEDNALEYLRMLMRGPFRAYSDLIRLEKFGKGFHALLLSNLDRWPANVLMNFCIASRVPIEFTPFLQPWAELCEKGYDPTLAFLIVYSRGYKVPRFSGESIHPLVSKLPRSFDVDRGGHMWLDPASSWKNILNGTMVNVTASYTKAPSQSRPTNNIWGTSDDYRKVRNMTDEEIVEFYTSRIEVLEPPPPQPIYKKAKKPNPFFVNYDANMPQAIQLLNQMDGPIPGAMIAHGNPLNPAVEVPVAIHDEVQPMHFVQNAQGAWGLAHPDEPQPQIIEHIDEIEAEDINDGFPDDWDAEIDND